jgi:hypothetical protein
MSTPRVIMTSVQRIVRLDRANLSNAGATECAPRGEFLGEDMCLLATLEPIAVAGPLAVDLDLRCQLSVRRGGLR